VTILKVFCASSSEVVSWRCLLHLEGRKLQAKTITGDENFRKAT